ncbi:MULTISPECIES: hypothetical protein [Actinomadura]|uniref:Tail terminator n=1 Tax=Actinomadura yumaensis TaxID=111807 RepID=A0ABW2CXH5_9ACTN|nr:hypothetical protein [Actinomadura sp. J1-007]MWK39573.1 hypothetical protein [Actinomadura sp. J1-007]
MPTPVERPPYPDAEDVAAALLDDLTTEQVVIVTPEDLQDRLPLQRVLRIGGSDDQLTDTARIVVDTYAATSAEARTLAEQTRQRFGRRRARTSAGIMDRATTEVAPHAVPHPNPQVRMRTAIYRLRLRRRT